MKKWFITIAESSKVYSGLKHLNKSVIVLHTLPFMGGNPSKREKKLHKSDNAAGINPYTKNVTVNYCILYLKGCLSNFFIGKEINLTVWFVLPELIEIFCGTKYVYLYLSLDMRRPVRCVLQPVDGIHHYSRNCQL